MQVATLGKSLTQRSSLDTKLTTSFIFFYKNLQKTIRLWMDVVKYHAPPTLLSNSVIGSGDHDCEQPPPGSQMEGNHDPPSTPILPHPP